jgi:lysophospholipase L1-like esterase
MKKKKEYRGNRRRFFRMLIWLLAAGAVVLALKIRWDKLREDAGSIDREQLEAGVEYIRQLEQKDTGEIEAAVKNEEKEESREAFQESMDDDDFNVWAYFGNIVLMGDSRTKEFSHSGFIESRRVLAEDGNTIGNIKDYLDDLVDLDPAYIILQYGINDMENPQVWESAEVYAEDLDAKIGHIHEAVPDAVVFVQSILPAVEPELSRLECRQEIPAWNEVIREHCEEEGIPYIDVTDVAEEYSEYYEPDGMHFTSQFYPYWAERLIQEVNAYEES